MARPFELPLFFCCLGGISAGRFRPCVPLLRVDSAGEVSKMKPPRSSDENPLSFSFAFSASLRKLNSRKLLIPRRSVIGLAPQTAHYIMPSEFLSAGTPRPRRRRPEPASQSVTFLGSQRRKERKGKHRASQCPAARPRLKMRFACSYAVQY